MIQLFRIYKITLPQKRYKKLINLRILNLKKKNKTFTKITNKL